MSLKDDFGLRVHEGHVVARNGIYRPAYNLILLKDRKGKLTPAAYDLDMSTLVSGYETVTPGVFNNSSFQLNKSEQSMFVVKFLEMRQRFPHEDLLKTIDFFKEKRAALTDYVQKAMLDDKGRATALTLINTFFENIDAAMRLPVITQKDVVFYKDTKKSIGKLRPAPVSDPEGFGTIRPGTPVIVLGKEGGLLKVAILNINYDLNAGENAIGYIAEDTTIAPTLPAELIGKVDERDMFGLN